MLEFVWNIEPVPYDSLSRDRRINASLAHLIRAQLSIRAILQIGTKTKYEERVGQKKWISIGGGEAVFCDYEELKQKLSSSGKPRPSYERILKEYFPLEFQEDCNNEAAKKRWDSWFAFENQTECRVAAWSHRTSDSPPYAFQHGNQIVIYQAKRAMFKKRVSNNGENMLAGLHLNNVSTFTGWLFNLQHESNASNLSAGKRGERLVRNAKLDYPKARYVRTEWEPLFVDELDGKQPGEKISTLTLNGAPMVGKPDYVFLNRQSRIAIVVEIKTSNAMLEVDGWPNLRAQLWAYAQLDIVREAADRVILIGEIWRQTDQGDVTLKRTYRWDFPNKLFSLANQQLFDLYIEYASC